MSVVGDSDRQLHSCGSPSEDSKKGSGLPRIVASMLSPKPDDDELL